MRRRSRASQNGPRASDPRRGRHVLRVGCTPVREAQPPRGISLLSKETDWGGQEAHSVWSLGFGDKRGLRGRSEPAGP